MFILKRLSNWAHSSVVDDRKELEIYQKFQDNFRSIDTKFEEYLKELGFEDERLFVEYNGHKYPLNYLNNLKESYLHDKTLTVEERAQKVADISYLYNMKLLELKAKVIDMAVTCKDNIYLAHINSTIQIINSLLKENSHLLAIQKSGVYKIDNENDLASQKAKKLKDNIEIRSAEINTRLNLEEMRRK